jgi:MFS family permease
MLLVIATFVLALAAASGFLTVGVIALVQQRIPDRHLAKALGPWEAGIAGAIAIAPVIAITIIDNAGVSTGFMLSGAALIVIGMAAALALKRTRIRGTVSSPAGGHMRANPRPPATSPARL